MWVISLSTVRTHALTLADALGDREDWGCVAASAFDWGGGEWRVEAYLSDEPNPSDLDALAAEAVPLAASPRWRIVPLDAEDSATDFIAAGRFRIWSPALAPIQPGRWDLVIEAGGAFGSGDHASTILALTLLDQWAKVRRLRRVLDLGTGTGVLGIAARRLFVDRVVLSDIEADAVAVARANVARSGLPGGVGRLEVLHADGLHHPILRAGSPYDLILANILPDPLVRLAPSIVTALAPRGGLVLAGLRVGEQARLIAAYRARGLVLAVRASVREWAGLVFYKP